ncbi:MAG: HD domain-containing protein [Desulfovibrionaceae bacterium]|nr:HD domain-containing protein [Desulfovibrionaceae bacterium]
MIPSPSCAQRPASGASCGCIALILHQFAESLGKAIDAKDHHTWRHSDEVADLARELALLQGATPFEADLIHLAGHLHDIGKIGVSDALLRKTGPLSVAEWSELRRHPAIGAQIVRPVRPLAEAGVVEMILHHHERFDGKGYPSGLMGAAIPFGARVIALADSVSAMLQDRPYRPARTFERVVDEIRLCAGSQFDPILANVFVRNADRFLELRHGLPPEKESALPAVLETALAV